MKWSEIGFITGAGNSSENVPYTFHDKGWSGSNLNNTYYYRLLQKNFDGTLSYSDMVTVKSCGDNSSKSISLFPNPMHDHLQIVMADGDDPCQAQIFSIQGQLILSESIMVGKSTIDVSTLDHGMYLIHIKDANHQIIHVQKLVR